MMKNKAIKLNQTIISSWESALQSSSKSKKELKLASIVKDCQAEVLQLWQLYTQDRTNLNYSQLNHPKWTQAYLVGFHLLNAARTQMILNRVQLEKVDSGSKKTLVIDIGCGTGGPTSSVISFLNTNTKTQNIDVLLIDSNKYFLKAAEEICKAAGAQSVQALKLPLAQVHWKKRLGNDDYDQIIVICSYSLNEFLNHPKELAKFEELIEMIEARSSLFLLMESATPQSAKTFMQFRDELIHWKWQSLYPCPSSDRCPMDPTKDWCYSEFEWEPPKEIRKLHETLKIRQSILGTSSYLFASSKYAGEIKQRKGTIAVGFPEDEKGNSLMITCKGDHLEKVRIKEASRSLRGQQI